ncbi:MAG: response regulator, partial [Planctomycetota bacterium]
MKLEELTSDLLGRAMDLYLEIAWPGREEEKRPELPGDATGRDLLVDFSDEGKEEGGKVTHRWVRRLGNELYPHMKLVVEESLVEGEYLIAVDTHDELELKPDFPDYEAWQALKAKNREIKDEIERRWNEEKLPTWATLKVLLERSEGAAPKKGAGVAARKILVVDDERDIADAVSAVLIGAGYDVLLAHDGVEAVDTALLERPDLILMDFQMPRMDGVEAAVSIRRTQDRKKCRILLATASLVDLSRVAEADG